MLSLSLVETDVIIIGAGVAGIAAAKMLEKSNIKVCVLEASSKVGGRASSQELGPGNWFDLGCSYLHNASINPFINIAKEFEATVDFCRGDIFSLENINFLINGENATKKKIQSFQSESKRLNALIKLSKLNEPIIEYMNKDHHLFPIFCNILSSLNGAHPSLSSAKDFANSLYEDTDYSVSSGLGNLVKKWSSQVNINLNTKVSQIFWDMAKPKVITPKGTIVGKKILLTVSTGVLASEAISIQPPLPYSKLKAIETLPMGTLSKIGFAFNKKMFTSCEDGYYVCCESDFPQDERDVISIDINSMQSEKLTVFVGGKLGESLELEGSIAMKDYAISKLKEIFGSSISKSLGKCLTTSWLSNNLSKGSYSFSKPTEIDQRKELAKDLNDSLYFAGEATATVHYGTIHGAFFSGESAASKICKSFQNSQAMDSK